MINSTVLIVDNDPDCVAVMKVALERERYTVTTASDTGEGMSQIQAVKSVEPQVLLDEVKRLLCRKA